MFNRIIIELSGPICKCPTQKLRWAIKRLADYGHTLVVSCDSCKQLLQVAPDQFKATITLKEPYPEKEERLPDGTVVDTSKSFFDNLEQQMKEE